MSENKMHDQNQADTSTTTVPVFTQAQIVAQMEAAWAKINGEHLSVVGVVTGARLKRYFMENMGFQKPESNKKSYICPICSKRIYGDSEATAICADCEYSFKDAQELFNGTKQKSPSFVVSAKRVEQNEKEGKTWTCIGCETVQPWSKKAKCTSCTLPRSYSVEGE